MYLVVVYRPFKKLGSKHSFQVKKMSFTFLPTEEPTSTLRRWRKQEQNSWPMCGTQTLLDEISRMAFVTRLTYNCAHLRWTKESLTFEYDIWWYWVSRRQYWLVLGGTGWYMMVLVQYKAVPVSTWWYWVRRRWYWLIHDGSGPVWGSTYWYMVAMDQC